MLAIEVAVERGTKYTYAEDKERRKRVRYDLRWPGIEDDRLRFKRGYRPGVKVPDYSEREDMRPKGPPRKCSGVCDPRRTITHDKNFCSECNARFGYPNRHAREDWQKNFEAAMVEEGYTLDELRCKDPTFNILRFLAQTEETSENEQRAFDNGADSYAGTVELDAAGWVEGEDGEGGHYEEPDNDPEEYDECLVAVDCYEGSDEVTGTVIRDSLVGRVTLEDLSLEKLQETFGLSERELALMTCGTKRWGKDEKTELQELAEAMDLTYDNAKQIKSRAVRRVREQLGDADIEDVVRNLLDIKLEESGID